MVHTMRELLGPETDRRRQRRCLAKAREYLEHIDDLHDPELAEYASAVLLDVILEFRMGRIGPMSPIGPMNRSHESYRTHE